MQPRDNRGLSLIELIVSVSILALIIAPLLHTILTAANTASRAVSAGDETLAAQNLMEALLAEDLNLLTKSGALDGKGFTLHAYDYNEHGNLVEMNHPYENALLYEMAFRAVSPTGSNESYDAFITLDATNQAVNGVGVTQYTAMDAIFAQPYEAGKNPDLLAVDDLLDDARKTVRGYHSPNVEESGGSTITRTITVTLKRDEAKRMITGSIEYAYRQTFPFTYEEPYTTEDGETDWRPSAGTVNASKGYVYDFYRNRYPETNDGLDAMKNLFIFYYPVYGIEDKITVYNNYDPGSPGETTMPLTFELHLIKQYPTDGSLFGESSYRPNLVMHQSRVTDPAQKIIPAVYTNINRYLVSGERIEDLLGTFTVYTGYVRYDEPYYEDDYFKGSLLRVETVNRFYATTLYLLPAGTLSGLLSGGVNPETLRAAALVTLEGSKLD